MLLQEQFKYMISDDSPLGCETRGRGGLNQNHEIRIRARFGSWIDFHHTFSSSCRTSVIYISEQIGLGKRSLTWEVVGHNKRATTRNLSLMDMGIH
jgi:hypothetical protein